MFIFSKLPRYIVKKDSYYDGNMLNNEFIGLVNKSTFPHHIVLSIYKKHKLELTFDKHKIYGMKLTINMFGRWYDWVVLRYINDHSYYKIESIEFRGYQNDDLVEVEYILNGPTLCYTYQSTDSENCRIYTYDKNINLVKFEYDSNIYQIHCYYQKNKMYNISIYNAQDESCKEYIL